MNSPLVSIETILEDAKAGRMFILVDDETRENEGDLVIPAQMADAAAINFMAKYGRGLICLSLDKARVQQLGLPPMARHNATRHQTAFTVSIEARVGVTTGISAADRAHTIAVAIDDATTSADIASPGHVFPLEAREGGVLVRAGHTEAAVDIARLAGLTPAGVICEIMNDDGTMARLPDLIEFAKKHDLHIATIADLIAYRRRSEQLVTRVIESDFTSVHGGDFRMIVYASTVEYAEHVTLIKGDLSKASPVLVRMHGVNLLHDALCDVSEHKSGELHAAMRMIGHAQQGVVVLIREPSKTAISDQIKRRLGTPDTTPTLRDYGIGAQILLDLGVKDMILLSNSKPSAVGLDGYGLSIRGYQSISDEGV